MTSTETRALDALKNALSSWQSVNPGGTLLEVMRARHNYLRNAAKNLVEGSIEEQRGLLASEDREVRRARTIMSEIEERIAELETQGQRERDPTAVRHHRDPLGLVGVERADDLP